MLSMSDAKAWIRSCGLGLGCLLVLLGLLGVAHAQGAASGIKGTVTDASGGVLPKANVVAEDAEKGIRRSTVTDNGGSYLLTGLPPGTYDVSVELSGFGTAIKQGLVVTVGQTGILDFHLTVASVKQTVEVSADLPTVDTEKSSQSNTMTEVLIKDLPIDRRDYLTFSLLAPGVSNSTRLADDTDYRVKQFSSSGLSFYGSNGRGNSVSVDGGEANDDERGVRLTSVRTRCRNSRSTAACKAANRWWLKLSADPADSVIAQPYQLPRVGLPSEVENPVQWLVIVFGPTYLYELHLIPQKVYNPLIVVAAPMLDSIIFLGA